MTKLLLGAPGSGKSFFVKTIKPTHPEVFDADYDIPGLAGWTDASGNTVVFPAEPTIEWLEAHSFNWNADVLKMFLAAHPTAIVCGIAANAFACAKLFDRAYYLVVDPETLRSRMLLGERMNRRGKTEAEVQQIARAITEEHLPQARAHGVTLIDATLSPLEIFESVVSVDKN
jgi:hypothetical protein